MRKLIVANIVSLDGYHEGPGKDVMAMPFDEAFDEYNAERRRHSAAGPHVVRGDQELLAARRR
jgi:hypothetical protein